MTRAERDEGRPVLDLIEEAFHLVRRAPGRAWCAYGAGALPFVLGLLYFWSDMSRSAFAHERLAVGAAGLTVLFVWMKTWQAFYARDLLARLCGRAVEPWTWRSWRQTAVRQMIVQAPGLFALPVALVLLAPFGWVYAFFQNSTVLGDGQVGVRSLVARAWRQATLWPAQNHMALLGFKLAGLLVAGNLVMATFLIPLLLRMLLGVESVFTRSPAAIFNTTLLASVLGLSYLGLDPFLKAVYVLRCFYGESLRTGEDLRAALRFHASRSGPAAVVAVCVAMMLVMGQGSQAGEAATPPASPVKRPSQPSVEELERSIERVIQRPEYAWRMPREKAAVDEQDESWLVWLGRKIQAGLEAIGRSIRRLVEKWTGSGEWDPDRRRFGWFPSGSMMVWTVSVILLALALLLGRRLWQRRAPNGEEPVNPVPTVVPDLTDASVRADELPEDGWIDLARELAGRGELRLALRALYLATLVHLAGRNLVTIARFKSNRDYVRELDRRGPAASELAGMFRENVAAFERVWYGAHQIGPEAFDHFARTVERIRALG